MALPAFILECVCVLHVHICRLTAFLKCWGIKRNIYLRLLSHGHALVTDPFYCMCVRPKKKKKKKTKKREVRDAGWCYGKSLYTHPRAGSHLFCVHVNMDASVVLWH